MKELTIVEAKDAFFTAKGKKRDIIYKKFDKLLKEHEEATKTKNKERIKKWKRYEKLRLRRLVDTMVRLCNWVRKYGTMRAYCFRTKHLFLKPFIHVIGCYCIRTDSLAGKRKFNAVFTAHFFGYVERIYVNKYRIVSDTEKKMLYFGMDYIVNIDTLINPFILEEKLRKILDSFGNKTEAKTIKDLCHYWKKLDDAEAGLDVTLKTAIEFQKKFKKSSRKFM